MWELAQLEHGEESWRPNRSKRTRLVGVLATGLENPAKWLGDWLGSSTVDTGDILGP